MVTNQTIRRSSISIFSQTKRDLDSIKYTGQSYDGLLQELLEFWREKEGEYWTQRKEGKIQTPV